MNDTRLDSLSVIDLALAEDLGFPYKDITTELFIHPPHDTQVYRASILSKHPTPIVCCGVMLVHEILSHAPKELEPVEIFPHYKDGDSIEPGQTILSMQGPAKTLWMFERTILNFLQRLCAIATLTSQLVQRIQHTATKILDTRKTAPGMRRLEKYAVLCGGGSNHRMGLYDAILIKDTHIDLLGGMELALSKLSTYPKQTVPVIVEVRDQVELDMVLQAHQRGAIHVDRVLLDNMSIAALKECVTQCHGIMTTEASGSINVSNVCAIAQTGVDFASVGCITHSAGVVDLSMKCHNKQADM